MPTVSGANLTLTPDPLGVFVTINVGYTAVFAEFERLWVADGTTFHPHIEAFGMDPAGSATGGTLLIAFPPQSPFPVTAGVGSQIFPRVVSLLAPRTLLNEDSGIGDDDEIRCKIRIHTKAAPSDFFTPAVVTDEEILIS